MAVNKIYRALYYDNILKGSTNCRKMWDNINVIINEKRPSSNIEKLQIKDKNFEQPFSISNAINKYFCGVPAELASKLPKSNHCSSSNMHRKKESFCVIRVNIVEVLLLLESIDIKKSFGLDKVHPLLLSSDAPIIYSPLTYVTNLSLKQGIFPDSLKAAKVIPIFKRVLAPYVTTMAPYQSFQP